LGGDYTHFSRFGGVQAEHKRRDKFFELMAGFRAPMGKFGVAGNHDMELNIKLPAEASLGSAMAAGGVTLLKNSAVTLERRGARVTLAGLDDWVYGNKDLRGVADMVAASECVILVSHNPDALPKLDTETAEYGNWVDLMLAGHTHGGQLTLFGFKMLVKSSVYGERFQSGWYNEFGVKMLVSNGVGSVFLPFRLGAPAQAHLLTLRSGANSAEMMS
jgi:predicted MPP superfamily phosphohydrolase